MVRSALDATHSPADDGPEEARRMHLTRREIKHVGAVASAAMAAIYALIGLGVLDIGGSTSGETVDLAVFGFSAGMAYLVLAVLLVFTDRRWLWLLAVLAMLWVYVIYVSTSGVREPAFEIWGIALRLIQLPLLAVLVYLAWNSAPSGIREADR
jgi:hypothetical protein